MSSSQRSKGLQDLLVELARFFQANETTCSVKHVCECLEHLSAIEGSAFDRLLILLHQTKSKSKTKTKTKTILVYPISYILYPISYILWTYPLDHYRVPVFFCFIDANCGLGL